MSIVTQRLDAPAGKRFTHLSAFKTPREIVMEIPTGLMLSIAGIIAELCQP
ncbi:hypothetical protein D3C81_2184780 [compost metagenome]